MRRALALAALLSLGACTVPEDQARIAIAANGMTAIELGGYPLLGCGRDDSFARSFTATTAAGQRVRGVVCSGVFKGATVRIDGVVQ